LRETNRNRELGLEGLDAFLETKHAAMLEKFWKEAACQISGEDE